MISTILKEFKTNNSTLVKAFLSLQKIGHLVFLKRNKLFKFAFRTVNFIFFRLIMSGEVPYEVKIGENLRLPHGINGTVINKKTIIGNNVTIYHQVTIGSNDPKTKGKKFGVPIIEDGVIIGAGSKIIGPIIIGKNSRIAPNSLVRKTLPENSIVYTESKILIRSE